MLIFDDSIKSNLGDLAILSANLAKSAFIRSHISESFPRLDNFAFVCPSPTSSSAHSKQVGKFLIILNWWQRQTAMQVDDSRQE